MTVGSTVEIELEYGLTALSAMRRSLLTSGLPVLAMLFWCISSAAPPKVGQWTPFQSLGLPRTGGYGLEAFEDVNGVPHIALASFFGNHSFIYRYDSRTGRYELSQRVESHAGHAWRQGRP